MVMTIMMMVVIRGGAGGAGGPGGPTLFNHPFCICITITITSINIIFV